MCYLSGCCIMDKCIISATSGEETGPNFRDNSQSHMAEMALSQAPTQRSAKD